MQGFHLLLQMGAFFRAWIWSVTPEVSMYQGEIGLMVDTIERSA